MSTRPSHRLVAPLVVASIATFTALAGAFAACRGPSEVPNSNNSVASDDAPVTYVVKVTGAAG